MMTQFRNSLTWRDTVKYAVEVYSFLIRGKGEMTGKHFADAIRDYYSGKPCEEKDGVFNLHVCYNERAYFCAKEVEKHITRINATYKGTGYYTI